ncbi:MAG: polysaccharide deacetylase family protein [Clostridium sp.]|nr:polysaccharide deacetylase family protein [Clostridium sp.]
MSKHLKSRKPKIKQLNFFSVLIVILVIILIALLIIIHFKNKSGNDNLPSQNISSNNKETITAETSSPETDTITVDSKEENRFEGLTMTNENVGVPVLYYHSVDPSEANEVIISPEKLREELTFIKDSGYTTLTMSELNDYILNNTPIPEKSIVITFDDGYADNYANAFPILKELDMKATIFVISNFTDKDGYYMTSQQIKEMSDYGIDIQSHTASHAHLNQLTYEEQLSELKTSKEKLESITEKPVISIAYPFGDFDDNTILASKEAGYSLSFNTNRGLSDREDNPLSLNRIYVSSLYSIEQFKEILESTKK